MLGFWKTEIGTAVSGVTIYFPSRVVNHDSAWASYSELSPLQCHEYSLNSECYQFIIAFPFINKLFGDYCQGNLRRISRCKYIQNCKFRQTNFSLKTFNYIALHITLCCLNRLQGVTLSKQPLTLTIQLNYVQCFCVATSCRSYCFDIRCPSFSFMCHGTQYTEHSARAVR